MKKRDPRTMDQLPTDYVTLKKQLEEALDEIDELRDRIESLQCEIDDRE